MRFWGTRGTIPAPGQETIKYGGNTTCVELVLKDGTLAIFDAGTGIKKLGQNIIKNHKSNVIHLFFTHTHWDHIQGFPLFSPAYADFKIRIYSCPPTFNYIKQILTDQMDSRYFPVKFEQLKANISFQEIVAQNNQLSNGTFSFITNNHPGNAHGFRIIEDGKRVVFITDNELLPEEKSKTSWVEFVDFCKDADLLIHDAHYLQQEMAKTAGFGHSSYEQVFNLGIEANVKHLLFFHHEPDRTDKQIESIVQNYRIKISKMKLNMKLDAATEGLNYIV